jgi:hypothetical protein
MATYQELVALAGSADRLRQQIKMAIAVSAFNITAEAVNTANHVNRLLWAKAALANPDNEVERVKWFVLAGNAAAAVTDINAATDAQVQTVVDGAVALFAS